MNKPSLSIFFPAYNEEANLEETIRQALLAVQKITPTYELIIVNDGSKDKTGEIADRLAKENDKIKVVHHNPNQGYGAALWSGIQKAQYEYVFFTDTDLQFDLNELTELAKFIPEYKIVLGYRAPRKDPFIRLVNAKLWNFMNRLFFGLKIKDIDCAFKLMDRELVANLNLKARGAMMSAEMLIQLQRKGIAIKEVPVSHFPRTAGVATGAKLSVIIRAGKEFYSLYKGNLGKVSRQQLARFAFVGIFNTLIDIGIYALLTRYTSLFSEHLLVAKTFSFIAGTICSFIFNRFWTFQKKTPFKITELIKFYITVGMGLLINVLSMSAFLQLFNLHDLIAVIFATIITFVWNFIASRLWVYSEVKPEKPWEKLIEIEQKNQS